MKKEYQTPVVKKIEIVQPEGQEDREWQSITYDGCQANLPKGMVINPEEFLAKKTLVSDTGAYQNFLEKYSDKENLSEAEIDQIYKETISQGIIDHHSIDSFLAGKNIRIEKCSAQIVADYPKEVFEIIKNKGIEQIATHFGSDMDAIVSVYFVKSLMQNEKLPKITRELAEITNKMDYGRYNLEAEKFIGSLPGVISAIKTKLSNNAEQSLKEKVFGNKEFKDPQTGRLNKEGLEQMNKIKAESEKRGNQTVFEILNYAERAKREDQTFSLADNFDKIINTLPGEIKDLIAAGQDIVRKNFSEFILDFEKAEKRQAVIKDKQGKTREVNLIIATSENPLQFTNLAYVRTSPDTIVAVYAGQKRLGGDMYDIGITPDMANTLDLKDICRALNEAEKGKRDQIYAKSAEQRTPEEQKLIETWESQPSRKSIAEDIIAKDPTVLVAGDSLIAASRTALLTEDDFKKVLRRFSKT